MSCEAAMNLTSDFSELLRIFNGAKVRYLVVGAYAVAHHAEPRFTQDFDVWVEPTPENAARVWRALEQFGAPLSGVSPRDFAREEMVYQMGVEPNRIDIIMGIDGVSFPTAWRNRVPTVLGEIPVHVLGKSDLIRNKRASGRPQDLLDLRRLSGPAKTRPRRRKR